MQTGLSIISVPYENASKSEYEEMKERKASDPDFKEWIKLRYLPKKRMIVVSCIRKRKNETLDRFLGNSNYS